MLDVLRRSKARYDVLSNYVDNILEGRQKSYPREKAPRTGVEGVPTRIWEQLAREARVILEAAGKLGLTAIDRGALARDSSVARHFTQKGLRDLMEQGRESRDRWMKAAGSDFRARSDRGSLLLAAGLTLAPNQRRRAALQLRAEDRGNRARVPYG